MMKEKQLVLDYSRDKGRLKKIRNDLATKGGGLFDPILTYDQNIENFLGEGYQKTISLSKNFKELNLKLDQTTALGGWCAIRTKCLLGIEDGFLTNPLDGTKIQVSFDKLISWIETSISGDQIIDSIGFYNGDRYCLISEQLLWSRKIIRAYELASDTKLSNSQKNLILDALKISENKRFLITKKYLESVKGKRIDLVKFTDIEIMDDLINMRDNLLKEIGISLYDLVSPFIENRFGNHLRRKKSAKEDLKNYVDDYSLIWSMYTGPYLRLLQKLGIVTTEYGVIIEPWSHSRSNEGQIKLTESIMNSSSNNHYLDVNGINRNLGFVAISESSEYNFRSTRTCKFINEVPNQLNYKKFSEELSHDESIANLDLASNKIFLLASNYLPYGKCKHLLAQMIVISNEYKNKKLKIKNNNIELFNSNNLNKKEVELLRNTKSSEMKSISLRVNDMLFDLFQTIFD